MTTGEVWRGIALALFCALVVGSVDSVLRPRLVGQDTKILAALFVTAWQTLGTTFRSALADRDPRPPTPTIGRQPDG